MKAVAARRTFQPRRQQGVVLFVALIVLVIMALVGAAMMRGSGSGLSVAGNLAFKQNATNVADIGTEAGRNWLLAQTAGSLAVDQPNVGYYSSWGGGSDVDPMALFVSANSMLATADDGTGNQVRYIVQRLCEKPNLASNNPAQRCADSMGAGQGASKGGVGYPGPGPSIVANPFYRISTQVIGPKNTVSYIQVVIQ